MATLTSTGRFAAGEACADNDIFYGPYATIAAAHAALLNAERNVVGRTVGIQTGNTIEEYWYQGGTTEQHLVKKQTAVEVDTTPTQNSSNAVSSGGVYNALQGKANTSDIPTISTNITTDATSDAKTASPKAVKTYVDNGLTEKQNTISVSSKISSDFVDDTDKTNKFVTSTEKGLIGTAIQGVKKGTETLTPVNGVVTIPSDIEGAQATSVQSSQSATATIDSNHVLQLGIPRGADAVNPFKGWFDAVVTGEAGSRVITSETQNLPANPVVGDYAYVKTWDISGTAPSQTETPIAKIYECATAGSWSDSGRTADTSNVQTFASNQEVNEVHIVNDLTIGGTDDVLSAEQGKILKEYLGDGVKWIPVEFELIKGSVTHSDDEHNGEVVILSPSSSSVYRMTDYLPVAEGDVFKITTGGGSSSVYVISAFDSNKNFLSNSPINVIGSSTSQPTLYDVTIPSGVSYIIAVGSTTIIGVDYSGMSIVKKTIIQTFIGDNFTNKDVLDKLSDIDGKLGYDGGFVFSDEMVENIIDGQEISIKGTMVEGGVLTSDNSVSSSSNNYTRTDYLSVTPGDNIKVITTTKNSTYAIAGFDANKAFVVSDINVVGTGTTEIHPLVTYNIVIPEGVSYIIVGMSNAMVGTSDNVVVDKIVPSIIENKSTLDKFSESNGELLWDGNPIGSEATISTLVADLPVSDGTGIASGYAYIDSTDRTIKVKS